MKPTVETVKVGVIRGRMVAMSTPRTRAQRRYRKLGYTWEIAPLRSPFPTTPKLVVIQKSGPWGWRSYRPYLLDFMGEVIRPVAKHYIHKGGKP